MNTKNIERYLNSFGQNVVNDSKKLLYSEKGSTALGKSIRFKVVKDATGFSTKFYMLDYGEYLDEGVSGNKKKQSFKDYKGKIRTSSYKYTTKGPPIDILSKWIKKKGIKPKGLGRGRSKKTGQYLSAFAYLISRKIKRDGIKSLSFFQKPLGLWYDRLQDDLLTEVKLDIETYLTTFYRPK
jgi:hypothetical protein